MNALDFKGFLQHRFRAMIHIGFSGDVLSNYPEIYQNIWYKWNELDQAGTADFRFRLNFQEHELTNDLIAQVIKQNVSQYQSLADAVNPSNVNYFASWFEFWVAKMFIPTSPHNWEEYLYTDIPVCYIYVSSTPEKMPKVSPPWMDEYSKGIPEYNLVVNPSHPQSSTTNPAFIPDASLRSLHDFLVWIAEREACKRLKALRKEAEDYIAQNWTGLRNSIMRFVGWGSGEAQRADTVKTLKRLGDLCMASGDFRAAFDNYQQLYQELGDDDPPLKDSLWMMFSISSILTTDELDIVQLLLPEVIRNKKSKQKIRQYIMILLVAIYYATNHCKSRTTVVCYKYLLAAMREFVCGQVSAPIIREAMSPLMENREKALFLYVAAREYRELGLFDNAWICFWRSYNCIWSTCWPRMAHALLLDIASIGDPPDRLLHMLTHKNLNYVEKTVEQLKKIPLKELIYMESIIVHDLTVNVTGFPYSPPPQGLAKSEWSRLRRWLFPVMYHPSTEEFATEMWNTGSDITRYRCANGEEYTISLKLSTTVQEPSHISNLQLFTEPSDAAETQVLEHVDLKSTAEIRLTFIPVKTSKFQIKGVKFLWFGVAPAAVLFQQPLLYESLEFESLVSLELGSCPAIGHVGIPCRFEGEVVKERGDIHSLMLFAESYPANSACVNLLEPHTSGFHNKFNLDPNVERQKLVFEVVPNITGPVTIRVFVSYAGLGHEMRFVFGSVTIDCRETKKVSYHPGSDRISLQPADDTYTVECPCAVIEQKGAKVRFKDAIPTFLEKKCTIEVHRRFNDTTITDILNISNVFVSFGKQEYKVEAFPAEIQIELDVLCLGANEGELVLRQPGTRTIECVWIGKTRFVLVGPKKYHILAKLLVLRPLECDIGELVSIHYGNSKPIYHHDIEVSCNI